MMAYAEIIFCTVNRLFIYLQRRCQVTGEKGPLNCENARSNMSKTSEIDCDRLLKSFCGQYTCRRTFWCSLQPATDRYPSNTNALTYFHSHFKIWGKKQLTVALFWANHFLLAAQQIPVFSSLPPPFWNWQLESAISADVMWCKNHAMYQNSFFHRPL